MFTEKKYTNNVFTKYKTRLVAGGNHQDKVLYESMSSSTVEKTSVMIILAVASLRGWDLLTADVEAAYLNTAMRTASGKPIYLVLNKSLAAKYVELFPKAARFVTQKGTLYVEVKKALYGCIQSSSLWQDRLTEILIGIGLVQSVRDRCLFYNVERTLFLGCHSDDLLVAAEHESSRESTSLGEKVARSISDCCCGWTIRKCNRTKFTKTYGKFLHRK